MAQINFKASSIQIEERASSYDPLPPGDYEMMVVASETRATQRGDGSYLKLEMHVISGPHSGRRHWENLNLDNPSLQTVKIAQEQLAKLCMALGLDEVEDSEDLHNRAFIAEVGIDKKDPTRNRIWNYKSVADDLVAPAKAAKPAAPARPAAPAAKATARPWG